MLKCQPEKKTETEAFVTLQDILKKTAERLCDSVALNWDEPNLRYLELRVTICFDSSASHIIPHQKNENAENEKSNPLQPLFSVV